MRFFHQIVEREKIEGRVRLEESSIEWSQKPDKRLHLAIEKEILYQKPRQAARARPDEVIGLDCVQAYVSNMSTATSLEELSLTEGFTLPESILTSSTIEWTAPKWAKAGDIVFFMHSKTAISSITALRSKLIKNENVIPAPDYDLLMSYLGHAREIHAKYGGKIFAVGRVCGAPEYVDPNEFVDQILHWKSRDYAAIDNIQVLQTPIDISVFRQYIHLSRGGSVTPLFDTEFDRLRADIGKENELPNYLKNAIARPIPLRMINSNNWIETANAYRRCFILEKQFRRFYVDYLIKGLGDRRAFFSECRCQRKDIHDSFMDYVIVFDGKLLPFEAKLALSSEPNIVEQVSKYVYNDKVFLTNDGSRVVTGEQFHPGKVVVIDTERLYMFNKATETVTAILDLDRITCAEDLQWVKQRIREAL